MTGVVLTTEDVRMWREFAEVEGTRFPQILGLCEFVARHPTTVVRCTHISVFHRFCISVFTVGPVVRTGIMVFVGDDDVPANMNLPRSEMD